MMGKYTRSSVRQVFSCCGVAALVLLFMTPAWAQNAGSVIRGKVVDESGGAIPGVTVTLASPVLQVAQMTEVTEADGAYRFGDLPAGTYSLKFELPGFKTFTIPDLRLTIGFEARADAKMEVGGLEETVTVAGASPVVDLATTTTSATIVRETLNAVPVGQGLLNVYAMTPGLTTQQVDVGDSQLGKRTSAENYGPSLNATIRMEGVDIADGANTSVYLSSASLDEIQIRTSGNDAEVATPGSAMVAVMKSGSNSFHGMFSIDGERPSLQSNNITPALQAQGLTNTNPIKYLNDVSGDIGGRIIRDQLWFYGSISRQDRQAGVPGFTLRAGPVSSDNPVAYVRARLYFGAAKVSYQPTPRNRFSVVYQPTDKWQPQGLPPEPSRFVPLSSTLDYHNPTKMYKGEYQVTLTPHTVFDEVYGYSGYIGDYAPWRSEFADPDVPSNPSRFDLATQIHTGTNPKTIYQVNDNYHWDQSLAWLPDNFLGGHHELKFGSSINWHSALSGPRVNPSGNYILVTDGGKASQIQITNAPAFPDPKADILGIYLKDTWRLSNALTLNLGMRYEYQHAYLPHQSRVASPDFPGLFPAADYPAQSIMSWNDFVPRLGVAWSLADKTVVKGTFGMFANGIGTGLANSYNPLAQYTLTYNWHDLNNDLLYQPNEVDLSLNGGQDFLSSTAVSTNALNKNLRQPFTTETTASFEREMARNLRFQTLFVYKRITDLYTKTNVLLPTSAWNIPLTRQDPGADGVIGTKDDGGNVTIWDYDAAYKGAAFVRNELRNYPDMPDHYSSIEFEMTKRSGGRWSATGSFWMTKYYQHLVLLNQQDPTNPNTNPNSLNTSWRWAGNISGSYKAPWGVQLGLFLQSKIGIQGQRTVVFRAADPAGGPSLKQQSTVTQAMDGFGASAETGLPINILDLRTSKTFSMWHNQLEFDADIFNLLNSSSQLGLNFQSGTTYLYATDAVPARIARIGMKYTF